MSRLAFVPLRRFSAAIRPRAWKPLAFPPGPVLSLPPDEKIEEETIPGYKPHHDFAVTIGDTLRDRYQVVRKLGYGAHSTVWLARDLLASQYVTLKIHINDETYGLAADVELRSYQRLQNASKTHFGHAAIRPLLDHFELVGTHGRHRCLVHRPLWDTALGLKHRLDVQRLPVSIVAITLRRLLQALDLIHEECHMLHMNINEANILLPSESSVLAEYEAEELNCPSAFKQLNGRRVYQSHDMGVPQQLGFPLLCDFGSTVFLDDVLDYTEKIQPDFYRSPEVIFGIPWSSKIDIWNVGCVVWDLFQGESLFDGQDPEFHKYRCRAHLAQMIALLGPPPASVLAHQGFGRQFFNDKGIFDAGIPHLDSRPLEDRETTLKAEGDLQDRELFLAFMCKMLQWEPEKRSSARDLIHDEWIVKHASGWRSDIIRVDTSEEGHQHQAEELDDISVR